MSDRPCTCHPTEAPHPCQKQYALTHCKAARIQQLEAEAKSRTLDYLGQVGQLSEELERLRAALEDIARTTYGYEPWMPDEEAKNYFSSLFFGAQAKARAALKPPTPPEAHNDRQV